MTAKEKIECFLRDNAGLMYCDDCLSEILDIKPRQRVQQKTSQLAQDNRYWRQSGVCARCREARTVIRLRMALVI
jgi:hypothetical protein